MDITISLYDTTIIVITNHAFLARVLLANFCRLSVRKYRYQ